MPKNMDSLFLGDMTLFEPFFDCWCIFSFFETLSTLKLITELQSVSEGEIPPDTQVPTALTALWCFWPYWGGGGGGGGGGSERVWYITLDQPVQATNASAGRLWPPQQPQSKLATASSHEFHEGVELSSAVLVQQLCL